MTVMVGTFEERLHDALLASGIGTVERLAVRAKLPDTVIRRAVETAGESLSFRQGLIIAKALKVRAHWLLNEDGPVSPIATGDARAVEVLAVFDSLPRARSEIWLSMGRWIAAVRRNQLPW